MSVDRERAERDAYCCIAEASLLRDADHARCVCDFLHRLIPAPRPSTEARELSDPAGRLKP